MQVFSTITETKNCLLNLKKQGKKIGFVPTMGALHPGHISLLQRAKNENDIAVASIFVNPLQFNDKKDLEKYPRTLENDSKMLESAACDVLFAPTTEEMYGTKAGVVSQDSDNDRDVALDLGNLDKVMEGLHRPGHFKGVCVVVKKLFDIIKPDKAYFGEKDFQQLAIIKHMVSTLKMPVEIIPCPTLRESDGLAMSSRNALLGADERKNAPLIYKMLQKTKEEWKNRRMERVPNTTTPSISEVKKQVEQKINENPFLKLEYFEIVNAKTLQSVSSWDETSNLRACIAVKAGAVRLIDNIAL